MVKSFYNQRGSVLVYFACMLPILLGICGLVVDAGFMYAEHTRLQNIADASALAGAAKLPNQTSATTLAEAYVNQNGEKEAAITFGKDKNNNDKINVDFSRPTPTYFMRIFNFNTVTINVHAAAIGNNAAIPDPFKYAVVSASKTGTLELGPGGGNTYNGDVYSNHIVNAGGGNNIVKGTVHTVDGITNNSGGFSATNIVKDTNLIDISMANSPELTSLVNAAIAAVPKGNVFQGNKDISGTDFSQTNGGVYVKGNLKMDWCVWPSFDNTNVIIADGDIYLNDSVGVKGNHQIFVCSLNGNITCNFSGNYNAYFYAPKGKITFNAGGLTIYGGIIGNELTLGHGTTTINRSNNDPIFINPANKLRLVE